ncbi:MAG: hypothetical protein K2M79_03860 [Muribaculaceae bacterium]|nr:hypothetical protein [Muribaculaceae bacterium]
MNEVLSSFFKQTNSRFLNISIGLSLVVVFIYNLIINFVSYFGDGDILNGYGCSEFLINFQGGFVRRGLLGEVLYQLYRVVPMPMGTVLTVICCLAFVVVMVFFIRQSYTKGYCWWILFSSFVLGLTNYIFRKDYILYIFLMFCVYLLRGLQGSVAKRLGAFLVIVFGLLLHEAFIFWGFPIYALLMLSYSDHRAFNRVLVILPLLVVFILCIFKGSQEVSMAIVDSWNGQMPDMPLKYILNNSIGALGWDSADTFMFHLRMNLGEKAGGAGIVFLPCLLLYAYYMITNFFYLFRTKSESEAEQDRLTLSLLYSFSVLCLLPMFTFLSCDLGRVFQYAAVATYAPFFIVPHQQIIKAFPKRYIGLIEGFNRRLNGIVTPSKGLLLIMLLFLGVSNNFLLVDTCLYNSIVGGLVQVVKWIRIWLGHLYL